MKTWTPEEEAARLAKRFDGLNRAEFARKHHIPGGASMIYQHIQGMRPISMEQAIAYARGFSVPLAEISPRLASVAMDALGVQPGELVAAEARAPYDTSDKFAVLHTLPENCQAAILTLAATMSTAMAAAKPTRARATQHAT
jgi:hypothetical protein